MWNQRNDDERHMSLPTYIYLFICIDVYFMARAVGIYYQTQLIFIHYIVSSDKEK